MAENSSETFFCREREVRISSEGTTYTGLVYDFQMNSMGGTYIDLPGHIRETADGYDLQNYPVEKLYRLDAVVIRLDRQDKSGAVRAEDLAVSCPRNLAGCRAMIINALGNKRFDDIEERSVYLSDDSVQWIIESGVHMLISDIYESKAIHGVFLSLFSAGVATVCCPVNMHLIKSDYCKVSVFTVPAKSVTQMPCRLIAEIQ